MLKVIAAHYVGPVFAAVGSFVFAALLLSATNTALGRWSRSSSCSLATKNCRPRSRG